MRKLLDTLYQTAMIAAVVAMVSIALLVFIQILGRLTDRVLMGFGADAIGIAIPSLAEIGGFLFVASSFLALPATLRVGGHVRVTMVSGNLPPRAAHVMACIVLIAAFALGVFAAWHGWLQVLDSWQFNSVSFGMIRIPLWIPQGAMALGLVIFAIALLDELLCALRGHDPAYRRAEKAKGADALEGH
ncbi:TRAP transporter small permease [Roseicitreum antarcticum]|uniref:TRAP transporter small permease protein n=1 Tax=Roseicitreum antarcticum TaxID=564137 RepID=A0A1H3E8X9_9RHOB|nr:TRAP transporter small permease [Roseicitreum antarcticum]SDX75087.1 TRAP-type C4-dicarboxylate transport system, small permease component [Roseicitreum antarcticum]